MSKEILEGDFMSDDKLLDYALPDLKKDAAMSDNDISVRVRLEADEGEHIGGAVLRREKYEEKRRKALGALEELMNQGKIAAHHLDEQTLQNIKHYKEGIWF